MENLIRTVVITRAEYDYLLSSRFLPDDLCNILMKEIDWENSFRGILTLPAVSAEEFRDIFSDRLVEVGFDKDYNPNSQGIMLENLIDKFFQGVDMG